MMISRVVKLIFLRKKISVKAEKGKALWWENMKDGEVLADTLHEGTPLISGNKYIVTSWWRENGWDGAGDEQQHKELKKPIEPIVVEKPKNESKIIKVNNNVLLKRKQCAT